MENPHRNAEMTDAAIAQDLIREAFPTSKWGTVQAACWQAFRKLKLASERRARSIWNGEALRIDAWEMDALRREAHRQTRAEYDRLKTRLVAMEAALRSTDPAFYRDDIAALREMRGRHGGEDSPVD